MVQFGQDVKYMNCVVQFSSGVLGLRVADLQDRQLRRQALGRAASAVGSRSPPEAAHNMRLYQEPEGLRPPPRFISRVSRPRPIPA